MTLIVKEILLLLLLLRLDIFTLPLVLLKFIEFLIEDLVKLSLFSSSTFLYLIGKFDEP